MSTSVTTELASKAPIATTASRSSLQAELNTFMADVATKLPAEVLAPVGAFYHELSAPDRFPNALKLGQVAPDFTLPDATGNAMSLSELRAMGPVILSFYRGAWCPFCNLELRALQAVLPEFRELGASLVAISPEQPDYSIPLIERHHLEFPVLSDLRNTVARQFGLVFTLEGDAKRISLETFGVDLPKFNGDDSWEIPVPATYVIDQDGTVRLAFFDPQFINRVEPKAIVEVLRKLQAEPISHL